MSFLKSMWKNGSRHKKLSEELSLQNNKENEEIEIEDDVVSFKLKYLGSTVVEKVSGDNISTEAVKNILKTVKASRKKLARANLNITQNGIIVNDLQGNELLKASIYRISNCSTDPFHRQVFSFVSTDSTDTTECHAFLCSKRKLAETVTLAVANSFNTAYEAWKMSPPKSIDEKDKKDVKELGCDNDCEVKVGVEERLLLENNLIGQLIDLNSFNESDKENSHHYLEWVTFEEEHKPQRSGYNQIDLILA